MEFIRDCDRIKYFYRSTKLWQGLRPGSCPAAEDMLTVAFCRSDAVPYVVAPVMSLICVIWATLRVQVWRCYRLLLCGFDR